MSDCVMENLEPMEIGDDDELLDMFFTNEEESDITLDDGGDHDYRRHVLCAPEIDAEVLEMFFYGRSSTHNKEQNKPINKVKKNTVTGKQNDEPQQPATSTIIINAPTTPPATFEKTIVPVTKPKITTTTTLINLEKASTLTTSRATPVCEPKKPRTTTQTMTTPINLDKVTKTVAATSSRATLATMHATPVTAAVNLSSMTKKVAAPMKRKASDMEEEDMGEVVELTKKSRVQKSPEQEALEKRARAALEPHYECPRCHGFDTRFYDFNNSSLRSIRYFCRTGRWERCPGKDARNCN